MFSKSQEIIETLEGIGWFRSVESIKKKEITGKLLESTNLTNFLYNLTICSFDTECIVENGDYVSIVKYLAENSSGKFNPTEITDEIDFENTNTAKIKFKHNEREYFITVQNQDDWFQPEVLDLVNQAVLDSGSEEQFMTLPIQDQCANLVFVPAETYEMAKKLFFFDE